MRTEVNKTEKSTLERVDKSKVVLRKTKKNDGQQQGRPGITEPPDAASFKHHPDVGLSLSKHPRNP